MRSSPATALRTAGALLLLAACTDASPRPLAPTEAPAVAKAAQTDTDSKASLVWHGTLPGGIETTGITDDGRGAYAGGTCGVRAKIFNTAFASNSGDLVFDPDIEPSGTCAERHLNVAAEGIPTRQAPFLNVRDIWDAPELQALGQSRVQPMRINYVAGAADCQTLEYGAFEADSIKVTLVAGPTAPRQWRVESTGAHQAACTVTAKNRQSRTRFVRLPFHVTVTELPPAQ